MPDRPPTAAEAARDAARAAAQAATALGAALEALSTALPAPLEGPSSGPPAPAARHIAEHRRGVVGKIESDAELRRFVMARIDCETFAEIERSVARNSPPERRVSDPSIARWWVRSGLAAARRCEAR